MNTRKIVATAFALAIAGAGLGGTDRSVVIGQPFQISKSVKEACEVRPQPMMCEQAMPLLAAMRSEARDPPWAARIEALIENSMRVGGKEWIQIRALECRSTRCALEYAVNVNDLDHDVDGNAELDQLMEPVSGMMAPEAGEDLRKGKIVSVLFWSKRA